MSTRVLLKNWFSRRKSRVNKTLERELGHRFALPFMIQGVDFNERQGFALDLPQTSIFITRE